MTQSGSILGTGAQNVLCEASLVRHPVANKMRPTSGFPGPRHRTLCGSKRGWSDIFSKDYIILLRAEKRGPSHAAEACLLHSVEGEHPRQTKH